MRGVRPQMKNALFAFTITIIALAVSAGDEFRIPDLKLGSAYQSTELNYRIVGIEQNEHATTIFVVANIDNLLLQATLNRIIKDITAHLRSLKEKREFTEIWFYSTVEMQSGLHAFRITDHVAVYRPEVNRSYYGVAAKHLYGGWAYGPVD